MKKSEIKLAYILAYRDPGYIRSRVLLSALNQNKKIKLYQAINTHKSALRYPETILKLLFHRLVHQPDVYLLGFRGHEILGIVRLLTFGRPLIFDEFVNLDLWLIEEHKKIKRNSLLAKSLNSYMRFFLNKTQLILTDTYLNAQYSAKAYRLPLSKFRTIYVGTEESHFMPKKNATKNRFSVFFYGNMLPLHGVEEILGAAKILRNHKIKFQIVGGKGKPGITRKIRNYIRVNKLDNVDYVEWVEYDELPRLISGANLCLGGPFGRTPQAQRVITGKTFQFLAMAKPTVIGSINESPGFVNKQNCLLVNQDDVESLAGAIKWAYLNRDKLEELGKNGQKLYKSAFSIGKVKADISRLLGEI